MLEWTDADVERFWNWFGSNPALADRYFSKQRGEDIVARVAEVISLRGTALDLGAGPGYLIEKLLSRGLQTIAVDSSPAAVTALKQSFEGRSGFMGAFAGGARIPLDDGSVDNVFLIETVEHLSEAGSVRVLGEARRVLRPGGYLVATTPHAEDLAQGHVICPRCACVFHAVQHVRSFSPETMSALMAAAGFTTLTCKPTYFSNARGWRKKWERAVIWWKRPPLPHLLYIGAALPRVQ